MDGDLDDRLTSIASSTDPDEFNALGCDLADAGRHGEAAACFRRAVSLGHTWVTFNLGNSLAALGRFQEAAAAYESALAEGETDAHLNLGMVLEELGDLAGAMRAYGEGAAVGDGREDEE
jgi:Flp pilus assembly protein TadD